MFLAVFLCLLLLLPDMTRSGFFNGMLEVFEPELLDFFTLNSSSCRSSLYPGIQPLLIFLFSDNWISDCPHPGLAFFLRITRTLAVASSFSLSRAYPSLNFLPSLSSLDPYSNYVWAIYYQTTPPRSLS